jgi:bifunctional non-homologous end joining protein LigD
VRLEIGGVLVSWAVPKGPTLDPSVRRAAIHVEDHPLEYFDFEGAIPSGQYGGGDVIVWDLGAWELHPGSGPADAGAAVAAGELHVDLYGEKLRGRFVFIRTGASTSPPRRSGAGTPAAATTAPSGRSEQWLLLHKHDDEAVPGWDPEAHPRSVLSGRTNDEVRAAPLRQWSTAGEPPTPPATPTPGPGAPSAAVAPDGEDRQAQLDQLDRLGGEGTWAVFGRELRVTNLDKVLWPGRSGEPPVTKRDLLRWSAQVAPVAMPYLAGRPLNMHRFPNGGAGTGFWQKELPGHAPAWVPRWENPAAAAGESRTYLVVDEPAALVWAANFGAVEWHAWTSMADSPDLPTYALIDLDPGTATSWADLLVLARLHRSALEHLGVRGWPKVTGRRGIQIWIPIRRGPSFSTTRAWVEQLSRTIGAVVPELVSWRWQVGDRGGLARLDYTQNTRNKTLVAPYSPRPAPGMPVSAPIGWEELDDPTLAPDGFTIRTLPARLAERGDLFTGVDRDDQELPPLE